MSVFPKTVFIPEKVPVVDSAKKSSNICPEQKHVHILYHSLKELKALHINVCVIPKANKSKACIETFSPQLDCIIIVKATSKGIILAEIIENREFNNKIF